MEKLKIVVDSHTAKDFGVAETLVEASTFSRCGTVGVIVRYEGGADETLKSVLAQTYQDIELVVLASKKKQEELAKKFGEELAARGATVTEFDFAEAAKQMQTGRVMLVGTKTELAPQAIAVLADSLQNANADVVVGGVRYVEFGKMSYDVVPERTKMIFGKNNAEKEGLLEHGLFALMAGKLIKRQLLLDAGKNADDAETLAIIASNAKTILLVGRVVCTEFDDNFDGGAKAQQKTEKLKSALKGRVAEGLIAAACVGLLALAGVGTTMAQGETYTEYEKLDSGLLSAIASGDASNLLAEIGAITDETETAENSGGGGALFTAKRDTNANRWLADPPSGP